MRYSLLKKIKKSIAAILTASMVFTSFSMPIGTMAEELINTEDVTEAQEIERTGAEEAVISEEPAEVVTDAEEEVVDFSVSENKIEIYVYYESDGMTDGESIIAAPWADGNLIDTVDVQTSIPGWSQTGFELQEVYKNWWKLTLDAHPTGGFEIHLKKADGSSSAALGKYDNQYNDTATYEKMTSEANNAIAIKDSEVLVNDAALNLVHEATIYIYDESGVPAIYIYNNASDTEWSWNSYPLMKMVNGVPSQITATIDGHSGDGNNAYQLEDASEKLGSNWYKYTFIMNTDLSGKVFQYDRIAEGAIDWNPDIAFSFDGTAGTVDASVILTEGKAYFKDGAFTDSIDTTLGMLKQLISNSESLNKNSYTESTWSVFSSALSSAKLVVSNNSSQDDAYTSDEITAAYSALQSAYNTLDKTADKTVRVYIYSDRYDYSALKVMPYSDVADYMKKSDVYKVGDEHPDWYYFDLLMYDGIENISLDGELWPGFELNNESWSASNTYAISKGATANIYEAVAIKSSDGDVYYVKDGNLYNSFDATELITLDMLRNLVATGESYAEKDYTADSFKAYTTVLLTAKEVLAKYAAASGSTQSAEIEKAYKDLLAADNSLQYSTLAEISVKKVPLNDDFITGADISSFVSIRQSGTVFTADIDGDGVTETLNDKQFFDYLKAGGTNWVRIRVWNDPYDASGNGYGGGNNDIEKAIILSKLAQNSGMKILIDFHYSDFWADPSKYKSPKAWSDYSNQQKADALYDFTYDCLKQLHDAGIKDIYMVQVGNESNHGLAGEIDEAATKLYGYGCEAVHDAAKNLYKHNIDAAVHFTDVQKSGSTVVDCLTRQLKDQKYNSHADGTLQYVPYDAIGVSYYPMYNHGDIDNLKTVLKMLAGSYGPGSTSTRVYVAETSWAWTWDDGDGFSNSGPSISGGQDVSSYSISVQGQADELRAVVDAVNSVNSDINDLTGFGVFWWEAAWISPYQVCYGDYSYDKTLFAKNKEAWEKYGSGWASSYSVEYDPTDAGLYYGGVGVDNMGWFGFDGAALPTAKAYSYIRTGASAGAKKVVAIEANQKIILNVGDDLELPKEVIAYYNDGSQGMVPITWVKTEVEDIDTDAAGWYSINGKVIIGDTIFTARLSVEVVANFTIEALQNSNFEDIENNVATNVKFRNWDVYGVNEDGSYITYKDDTRTEAESFGNATNITINTESPKGGVGNALNFWHAEKPLDVHIYQKIGTAKAGTNFVPGTYTFGGYIQGGSAGEYDKQYAVAYVYDSEEAFNKDLEETKKNPWVHPLGTDAAGYKGSKQFAGWLSWQNPEAENIQVKEGQYLVVGFEANGSVPGAWGSVDDAYLYGNFNVKVGLGTGNGEGNVKANRYTAGSGQAVKITAISKSSKSKISILDTIEVTGDGVNDTYFTKEAGWTIQDKTAIYKVSDAENAHGAVTVKFNMPESDVDVKANFVDLLSQGLIDVNNADIKLNGETVGVVKFFADGKQIKPVPSVSYRGYTFPSSYYQVSYGTNTEKGENAGSITILGKGNGLAGTREIKFDIYEDTRKEITSVVFNNPDIKKGKNVQFYYTGEEITFDDKDITVMAGDEVVPAAKYTLGYDKNKKVGSASLYVTPVYNSSEYKGSLKVKFKIIKADISKLLVEGSASCNMIIYNTNGNNTLEDKTWTKEGARNDDISVIKYYTKNNVIDLNKNRDFKVTSMGFKKVSTTSKQAYVVIRGKKNFTGKAIIHYNVTPQDLTDAKVLIQPEDMLEGQTLKPKVNISLETAPKKKYMAENYIVSVYDGTGKEVTGEKAKAGDYTITVLGKNNLKGIVSGISLRVVDREHMVTTSTVKFGKVYYQASAINLKNGTLNVDESEGRSVSINSIKVRTARGNHVLTKDQFEITRYMRNTKAGTATLYLKAKSPYAGNVVAKFKINKIRLTSYDKYMKKVSEGKAWGWVAFNHPNADVPSKISVSTNLFDVMTADTTRGKEQYYTGWTINPTYNGTDNDGSGLRIYMNGDTTKTKAFTDYTMIHTKNIMAAKTTTDGSGIAYGGQNIQDPVKMHYKIGSGAIVAFYGTKNYTGMVKFLDAFYIHPRTISDLVPYVDTSAESVEYVKGNVKPALKFKDPKYGDVIALKENRAFKVTYMNNKDVAGANGEAAPTVKFFALNDLVDTSVGKDDAPNKQTLTFAISAVKIKASNVPEIKAAPYKNGKAVEPKVIVYGNDGRTLSEGKDYIVLYANNYERCGNDAINLEKVPTATIIGIGNYTGEVTKTFTIK